MSAEKYIRDIYEASKTMSDNEVRAAIDELCEKRIAEIRNTQTNVKVSGKSYYVSAEGDDANDGLSPEKPWKTMKRVTEAEELCAGDGVFFRRGDEFRGQVFTKSGVTYSAYGSGKKPVMRGFHKNVADASLWKKTEIEGIWEYAEVCELDIGNIVFNDKLCARKIYRSDEEDGTHLDSCKKIIFNDWHDLCEDFTFFHETESLKVYLRCNAGNPAELYNDIEFTPRLSIFPNRGTENVLIDNLCFSNGNFGVSGKCPNETIQNCEFRWIGGCIQAGPCKFSPSRRFPTPYGNGIEIYGEAVNFTVDNCYFWQNYDAAMTHQIGSKGNTEVHTDNVKYINNVCEECVYSVEIFLGESELDNRSNNNTLVANNILRKGGGFGHDARPDRGVTALIRNGAILKNTTDYIVKNNIFDRSRERIISTAWADDGGSKAQYFDNIYVQNNGGRFCRRFAKDYVADENLGAALEETGTEHGAKIILIDELGF